MGTNYYWTKRDNCCEHCNRADEETLHIGKSSMGWHFALHVHPEEGINTLDDWKAHFSEPNSLIKDEYGDAVSVEEMLSTITNRSREKPLRETYQESLFGRNRTYAQFMADNHAVEGKGNLLAANPHSPYGHCIGHGEGTWDYITGDFS